MEGPEDLSAVVEVFVPCLDRARGCRVPDV